MAEERDDYSEIRSELLKERIILINDDFTQETCSYWAGRIIVINKQNKSVEGFKKPPITLLINSSGGDTYSCFGLLDVVKRSAIPVHTVVSGEASSCAAMLLAIGKKRYATESSTIMIHTVWEDFEDGSHLTKVGADVWKKEFDRVDESMKLFWKAILPPETTKRQLEEALHKDTYLTPEQAKNLHIIDVIGWKF